MTNAQETDGIGADETETASVERSIRVETVAWLAGISACVGFGTLPNQASIGTGIAFVAIAAMVGVVCCFILRARD